MRPPRRWFSVLNPIPFLRSGLHRSDGQARPVQRPRWWIPVAILLALAAFWAYSIASDDPQPVDEVLPTVIDADR